VDDVFGAARNSFPFSNLLERSKRNSIYYCSRGKQMLERWLVRTKTPVAMGLKIFKHQRFVVGTFDHFTPTSRPQFCKNFFQNQKIYVTSFSYTGDSHRTTPKDNIRPFW